MSRNIDYYEGDGGDEQEGVHLGAMELIELIEQKLEGGSEGKPEYWRIEVNKLIEEYNERFGERYERV